MLLQRTFTRHTWAPAIVTAAGLTLIAAAALADQAWFDRHFIPVLFLPSERFMLGEQVARAVVGIAGLLVATVGAHAARHCSVAGLAAAAGRVVAALLLSALVCEAVLRLAPFQASEEDPTGQEPLRRSDPELGWVFVPRRHMPITRNGRTVDYAFDARGYRVRDLAHPVDVGKPTILFAGESIMVGYGLPWRDSIPARVGETLRIQSANLGEFGYSDDQTCLRLMRELPRFARPAAVVVLFMPGLMFRDFNTDRPHLGPGLTPVPASRLWRLAQLLRFYVPYHSGGEIERVMALVRSELRAEAAASRSRGAVPLIVVPHYNDDGAFDRMVRRQVLDEAGLPYVRVKLDPGAHFPDDVHPNARGAAVIAAAIAERLRRNGLTVSR